MLYYLITAVHFSPSPPHPLSLAIYFSPLMPPCISLLSLCSFPLSSTCLLCMEVLQLTGTCYLFLQQLFNGIKLMFNKAINVV